MHTNKAIADDFAPKLGQLLNKKVDTNSLIFIKNVELRKMWLLRQ